MRKLLITLLLLATAAHAQVAGPIPPKILQIDAGSGITITTNGTRRVIAAPGAAGDITAVTAGTGLTGGGSSGDITLSLANTAVTAGAYTIGSFTVDAQGRLTAASSNTVGGGLLTYSGGVIGLSTNSVRTAIQATDFSPQFQSVKFRDAGNVDNVVLYVDGGDIYASSVGNQFTEYKVWGENNDGSGSTLDADLLDGQSSSYYVDGTIEAQAGAFELYSAEQVGWSRYYVSTGTNGFLVGCAKTAVASEQDGVFVSNRLTRPRGFSAYANTGAFVLDWVADSTTIADIRQIRVLGYNAAGGNYTLVLEDNTVRNVATVGIPSTVSIDVADFETTSVFNFYQIEVAVTVESSKCAAILNARLVSQ